MVNNLETYRLLKQDAERYINNRYLYISKIIRGLFDPKIYNFLCEIGAGELELSKLLIEYYNRIDAYEMFSYSSNTDNNRLKTCGMFRSSTDVSVYDLLLSICPYCYSYSEDDYFDEEEETKKLIKSIINMSRKNNTGSFIVLPDTKCSKEIVEEVRDCDYDKSFLVDSIVLHFEKLGVKKTSNNSVLIRKCK